MVSSMPGARRSSRPVTIFGMRSLSGWSPMSASRMTPSARRLAMLRPDDDRALHAVRAVRPGQRAEGVLVHHEHDRARRVAGAALGQPPDDVEQTHEVDGIAVRSRFEIGFAALRSA